MLGQYCGKYHICREKMQLSRAKPGNPASQLYDTPSLPGVYAGWKCCLSWSCARSAVSERPDLNSRLVFERSVLQSGQSYSPAYYKHSIIATCYVFPHSMTPVTLSWRNSKDGANVKRWQLAYHAPCLNKKKTCHWATSPVVKTGIQVSALTAASLPYSHLEHRFTL